MWNQLRKMSQNDLSEDIYYHAERETGDIKEGKPLGIYFTQNEDVARTFGQYVSQANLNIKNPLRIEGKKDDLWFDIFSTEEVNKLLSQAGVNFIIDDEDEEEFFRFVDYGGEPLKRAIMKAGYDALIYPETQGYRKFYTTLVFNKGKIDWRR